MKHSQQRLLFQAATSEQTSRITDHVAAIVTLQENRFHLSRWIAVILALLFFGCASLTPERIAVLTAIATQAAQLGAQQWLAKHPEHRAAFEAVIAAINTALKAGDTKQAIELLHSLPTTTLRGTAGEVYVTDGLVIWDPELAKAVRVTGAAEKPVVMAVRDGLRRAVAPKPPALPGPRTKPMPTWGFQNAKPDPAPAPTPPALPADWRRYFEPRARVVFQNANLQPMGGTTPEHSPTNVLYITPSTNITRSVLDVQTHAGSVPVVTVRWRQAPGGVYHVQQRESELATNWWTFATVTNFSRASSTNWSVPWPPGVQVGLWRVLRVR